MLNKLSLIDKPSEGSFLSVHKARKIMMKQFLWVVVVLVSSCAACQQSTSHEPAQAPPAVALSPSPSAEAGVPTIVAFGDSLTAGYGLSPSETYPSRLQEKLNAAGYEYRVINAGLTGDTAASGLKRLDWALNGNLKVVIVELGGNDILRSHSIGEIKEQLGQIIKRIQTVKAEVLLAGLHAPDSADPAYQKEVREAYQSLASEYKVVFIPFLLKNVAGVKSLNLDDGIHPNAEGTKIMADTVYSALLPMLERAKQGASSNKKPPSS